MTKDQEYLMIAIKRKNWLEQRIANSEKELTHDIAEVKMLTRAIELFELEIAFGLKEL